MPTPADRLNNKGPDRSQQRSNKRLGLSKHPRCLPDQPGIARVPSGWKDLCRRQLWCVESTHVENCRGQTRSYCRQAIDSRSPSRQPSAQSSGKQRSRDSAVHFVAFVNKTQQRKIQSLLRSGCDQNFFNVAVEIWIAVRNFLT